MTAPSIFDQWYPVTYDFGLIDAPVERVSQAYQSWWTDIVKSVRVEKCVGTLDQQFSALLPLSIAKNQALILPTTTDWTAFFRNGIQGSDPASAMPVLARQLHVRAMRICIAKSPQKYRAVIWELYEPNALHGAPATTRRSIAAANDGGRWVFETHGTPFEFEKTEHYDLPRKADRFTSAMLQDYLAHFGIDNIGDKMFADDAHREGRLIACPEWDHAKSFSLEDVKSGAPWKT